MSTMGFAEEKYSVPSLSSALEGSVDAKDMSPIPEAEKRTPSYSDSFMDLREEGDQRVLPFRGPADRLRSSDLGIK